MGKKKRKKKKNWGLWIAVAVAAVLLVVISGNFKKEPQPEKTSGWIASDYGEEIQLYTAEINVEKNLFGKVTSREFIVSEAGKVYRGQAVTLVDDPETDEEGNIIYEQYIIDEQVYYIIPGGYSFVENYEDVITETDKYVRTPVTIYEDSTSAKIAGFAAKGSHLKVVGFNTLDENGLVDMYKVSYEDVTGYVFSKYLVDDQESADAVYNEEINGEKVTDYHKECYYRFELYGGSAENLDYYPTETISVNANGKEFLEDARTMRLTAYCSANAQDYLECAQRNGCNAVCIDILDGVIGYDSEVAKELCPTGYANRYSDTEAFENMVKLFKDAGFYVIGRIVTFKDTDYAKDHPEDCYEGYYGDIWPSVYNRDAWYYKVAMALECVEKMGFDEIQFDYVRFEDASWWKNEYGDGDFGNVYGEEMAQAVQNFLFYACDMLHRAGAYVSVDVFGESSWGYVTAYGQYWPAISNVVDAISGMPYTDHFGVDAKTPNTNSEGTQLCYWEDPYWTVNNWAKTAANSQLYIPTPAVARTWITGYDTPYWNPYMSANKWYLQQQCQGLWDAGLTGGFITWGNCEIWRYDNWGSAWTQEY